jgi:uncharacterized protein (DUF2062 family)
LNREFENDWWTITAAWEEGKFDKFNTDFYLEVDYRKGTTISLWENLTVAILVGAVIIALLAALYFKRVRK